MKENRLTIIILSPIVLLTLLVLVLIKNKLAAIDNILISLLAGFLVSLVISSINYRILKKRIKAEIFMNSLYLYRSFSFIMFNNCEDLINSFHEKLNDEKLVLELRNWENYYYRFISANNDFKMFFSKSKECLELLELQTNIAKLSLVVNTLFTESINSKVKLFDNSINVDKVIKVIKQEDEEKLINKIENSLEILRKRFKNERVQLQ